MRPMTATRGARAIAAVAVEVGLGNRAHDVRLRGAVHHRIEARRLEDALHTIRSDVRYVQRYAVLMGGEYHG